MEQRFIFKLTFVVLFCFQFCNFATAQDFPDQIDVIFLVDVSGSMAFSLDGSNLNPGTPTEPGTPPGPPWQRFYYVKNGLEALSRIIEKLYEPVSGGGGGVSTIRYALARFPGENENEITSSEIRTYSGREFRAALNGLNVPLSEFLTPIGTAIRENKGAIHILNSTASSGPGTRDKIVFLVTDGKQHGGENIYPSFYPASGPAGKEITIWGYNFTGSTVNFNGTPATDYTITPDFKIQAKMPAGASTGKITVTNSHGSGESLNNFVVIKPPRIDAMDKSSGPVGSVVTVSGDNFTGTTAVYYFNDAQGIEQKIPFSLVSNTRIQATIPLGVFIDISPGKFRIVNEAGNEESSDTFTLNRAPLIISLDPPAAPAGQTITISGRNFSIANSDVSFLAGTGAPIAADLGSITTRSIEAVVHADASTGKIKVATPEGDAISTEDFVVITPPVIGTLSPSEGPSEMMVKIDGENFTGTEIVRFSGVEIPFTLVSDTDIRVTIPPGAAIGSTIVEVVNSAGSATGNFEVTDAPLIVSITPPAAVTGERITILGRNFSPDSEVHFLKGTGAPIRADIENNLGTSLEVKVHPDATTGNVRVKTLAGAGISLDELVVITKPAIDPATPFDPPSGPVGRSVTISGNHFNNVTTVAFNGVPAIFSLLSNDKIQAIVPSGAVTGPVSITNNAGITSSSTNFTVNRAPLISGGYASGSGEKYILFKNYIDQAANTGDDGKIKIVSLGFGDLSTASTETDFEMINDISRYYEKYNPDDATADIFTKIAINTAFSNIWGRSLVLTDPSFTIEPGSTQIHNYPVTEFDERLLFVVSWQEPDLFFSNDENSSISFTIETPSDVQILQNDENFSSGKTYQLYTFQKQFIQQRIGNWKLIVEGTGIQGPREYSIAVLGFSDLRLQDMSEISSQPILTGDSLHLKVSLTAGDTSATNANIAAKIIFPKIGAGNWFANNPLTPSQFDSVTSLNLPGSFEKFFKKSYYLRHLNGIPLPGQDTLEIPLSYRDDKKLYQGKMPIIFKIPGIYNVEITAKSKPEAQNLRINRTSIKNYFVQIKPDLDWTHSEIEFIRLSSSTNQALKKTTPKAMSQVNPSIFNLQEENQSDVFLARFTPMDQYSNLLKPGKEKNILVNVRNAHRVGSLVDSLDGSYYQVIYVPKKAVRPTVEMKYNDFLFEERVITDNPRADNWRVHPNVISLRSGAAVPFGNTADFYNQDFYAGIDFNRQLNRDFALLATLGFSRLEGKTMTQDFSNVNISANLRWIPIVRPKFRFFLNGGGGLHFPENDSAKFGLNAGAGIIIPASASLDFILAGDYHYILANPDNFQFSQIYGGLQIRF